jgi:hypothetical protein
MLKYLERVYSTLYFFGAYQSFLGSTEKDTLPLCYGMQVEREIQDSLVHTACRSGYMERALTRLTALDASDEILRFPSYLIFP